MKLIATNGEAEAWAEDDFDPETDEVELRAPGETPVRVLWQRALKFGFWNEP